MYKNYLYIPSEIIISLVSGYFVKSNTTFNMCVHVIVFFSHTGSKRAGEPGYVVHFILKIQLSRGQY